MDELLQKTLKVFEGNPPDNPVQSANLQAAYQLVNQLERLLRKMGLAGEFRKDASIFDELEDAVRGWRQEFSK